MQELTIMYLQCMDNFNGRYVHENKVRELIQLFGWQINLDNLLETFPAGSKAGDLLRAIK